MALFYHKYKHTSI